MKKALPCLACGLLVLLLTGCPNPASSGSGADSGMALLKDYGVKTSLGNPTDANGNALPDTYNPLGYKTATVMERNELFISGFNPPSGNSHGVLVDESKSNSFGSILASDSDDSWAKFPHATAAGDIDGDGVQEAVSVAFKMSSDDLQDLAKTDNKASAELVIVSGPGYARTTAALSGTFHLVFGDNNERHSLMSIALGDIDGDGRDEIGICVGNTFEILDDKTASYGVLFSKDYRNGTYTDFTYRTTTVAAGDINGDGRDEFIVADGIDKSSSVCSCYVYGGSSPALLGSGSVTNGSNSIRYASIATGDIDGDGATEVVFAGPIGSSDSTYNVLAAKWSGSTLGFLSAVYQEGFSQDTNLRLPLVCFNPAMKGTSSKDYVYAEEHALLYDTSSGSPTFKADAAFEGITGSRRQAYRNCATAGDFNEDGQEELALLCYDDRDLFIIGYGSSATFKQLSAAVDYGENDHYDTTICAVDVRGNSSVVEFQNRDLKFTNPEVIAVLASPPYYGKYVDSGSLSNYQTTFGKTRTSSTDDSYSFTVNASFTVGSSVEAPLWGSALSVTSTATFGASFTYAAATTKERETEQSYSTIGGEDLVIFTCIPIDVYTYKVLKAADPSTVGSTVTINMPRTPQLIPMERTVFNALSNVPVNIGSSVLTHTMGNPASYPSYATIKALESDADTRGLWDPNGMSIGVSGAFVTDEVAQSTSKSSTYGAGFSYEASLEVVAGGALFGTSYGFEGDYNYTVSTSEGTIIEGIVPNLPTTATMSDIFKFGISAYKAKATGQKTSFMVVTYWVDKS